MDAWPAVRGAVRQMLRRLAGYLTEAATMNKREAETICDAIDEIETGRAVVGVARLRNLLRDGRYAAPPLRVVPSLPPLEGKKR
jgi:hypothetical protein